MRGLLLPHEECALWPGFQLHRRGVPCLPGYFGACKGHKFKEPRAPRSCKNVGCSSSSMRKFTAELWQPSCWPISKPLKAGRLVTTVFFGLNLFLRDFFNTLQRWCCSGRCGNTGSGPGIAAWTAVEVTGWGN